MNTDIKTRNPMDIQVGGGHYKDLKIQPAEFWIVNNLPATQGAIVKYLTRHRFAKGREDLEKARHFVEMLIHWYFDVEHPATAATWNDDFAWVIFPEQYTKENDLGADEDMAVIITCRFRTRHHLVGVIRLIDDLIEREYPDPSVHDAQRSARAIISRKNQALAVAIDRFDDIYSFYCFKTPLPKCLMESGEPLAQTLEFLRQEFRVE